MAVDGIHVNIGKLFRKTSIVATFDNFVVVRKKASGKIETIILDLPFIYQISKKSRARSSAKVKMPLLEKFFGCSSRKIVIYIMKNHLSSNGILQWTFHNPPSSRAVVILHCYNHGFHHQNNPFEKIYSAMMNLQTCVH